MLRARVFDPHTLKVQERMLAVPDEPAARALLKHEGLLLLSSIRARGGDGDKRVQAAVFCRELQSLVVAGLSVVEALEALADPRAPGSGAALAQSLLGRLQAGRSLSAAMGDVGGLPELLVAAVRASERTSNLPEALSAFLQYDDMLSRLQRRVVSAALYPALISALGAAIAVFLLWVVLPRFAALYAQVGHAAGGVTLALVTVSRVLRDAPWLVPAGLVLLATAVVWLKADARWQAALDAVTQRVAWMRRARRDFELARQFEAMALLVNGGYTVSESLAIAAQAGAAALTRGAFEQSRLAVERGQPVSRALAAAGLTDGVTERLLRASEGGGAFHEVLHTVSQRHGSAFETFVDRATRLVEPVLLLGVAAVIGTMVIMLYMPIFDIASSVR